MKNSTLVSKIIISAFSLSLLFSASGCAGNAVIAPPVPVKVEKSINANANSNAPAPISDVSNSQPEAPVSVFKFKGPEINNNRTFKSANDLRKDLDGFSALAYDAFINGSKPVINQDGSQSIFLKNNDGSFKYELRTFKKGNIDSSEVLDKDGYLVGKLINLVNDDNSKSAIFEDSSDKYIITSKLSQNIKNAVVADNLDGTVTIIERDIYSKEISRSVVNKPLPFLSKFDDKSGIYMTSNLNEDGTVTVLEVDKDSNIKKRVENKSFFDSQAQFTINHL